MHRTCRREVTTSYREGSDAQMIAAVLFLPTLEETRGVLLNMLCIFETTTRDLPKCSHIRLHGWTAALPSVLTCAVTESSVSASLQTSSAAEPATLAARYRPLVSTCRTRPADRPGSDIALSVNCRPSVRGASRTIPTGGRSAVSAALAVSTEGAVPAAEDGESLCPGLSAADAPEIRDWSARVRCPAAATGQSGALCGSIANRSGRRTGVPGERASAPQPARAQAPRAGELRSTFTP